jgi:hypothetical protein
MHRELALLALLLCIALPLPLPLPLPPELPRKPFGAPLLGAAHLIAGAHVMLVVVVPATLPLSVPSL